MGRYTVSARTELRWLGYTAIGASIALAGSAECMHMGPVREANDETICLDCERRFGSIDQLAKHGGWDIPTRKWLPLILGDAS